MKITVEMNNFLEYKKDLFSGIIELEDTYNALVSWFMELDTSIEIPKQSYKSFEDKILKDFRNRINKLKEGSDK